jgi:ADP-L-glycero-D-manno-heptose 6-epimerase
MGALYRALGRELEVEWIDLPDELADRYQYFTEADMSALRQAGYDKPFLNVEDGVRDYARLLASDDPYR